MPPINSTAIASRPLRPLAADSGPFMIADIARRWRCAQQHVIDLIEEGKLQAIDIAGANRSRRRFYRVPAESVRAFEAKASSLNGSTNHQPRRPS